MSNWRFALLIFFIADVVAGLLIQPGDSSRALTLFLGQLAFGAPIALLVAGVATFLRMSAKRKTH